MAKTKNKTIVIDPGNQITIDTISELYKSFLKALKDNNSIELRNKSIEIIDLAGIQFIQFAKIRTESEGKKLLLNISLSNTMIALLQSSGFQNLLSA